MTHFYLVRHATNDLVGRSIAGRMPGVHLNAEGRQQAQALAEGLCHEPIRSIFSSPMERCRETASALAEKIKSPVHISAALNEIDFGDWTGCPLAELEPLEQWKLWNSFRSRARIPKGEIVSEVQSRMVTKIEKLHLQFPESSLAIVSHGDPIKSVLMHYLGVPLDLMQRLEIDPASVSLLEIGSGYARVVYVNSRFK